MQRHYFADKDPYSQSYGVSMGFPGGSAGKKNPLAMWETWAQ